MSSPGLASWLHCVGVMVAMARPMSRGAAHLVPAVLQLANCTGSAQGVMALHAFVSFQGACIVCQLCCSGQEQTRYARLSRAFAVRIAPVRWQRALAMPRR